MTQESFLCNSLRMQETTKERAERIGGLIRLARDRRGMSQVQLAAEIAKRAGIEPEAARRSLSNHETGRFAPRHRTLEVIAEVTGVSMDFFSGEPEVSPPSEFRG